GGGKAGKGRNHKQPNKGNKPKEGGGNQPLVWQPGGDMARPAKNCDRPAKTCRCSNGVVKRLAIERQNNVGQRTAAHAHERTTKTNAETIEAHGRRAWQFAA